MSRNYTTKTPSLKTHVANIRKLEVKDLIVGGANINNLTGLKIPDDLPKLVTRCELPEDKPWALWTDNGNLVYFNQREKIVNGKGMFKNNLINSVGFDFLNLNNGYDMFRNCRKLKYINSNMPSLTNGYGMFNYCPNLTSFTGDLSSLTDGTLMFFKCKNLEHFSGDLSSLTNGNNMFAECRLDKESVLGIIKCIKEKNTSPSDVNIVIGMSEEAKNSEEVLAELNVSSGWSSATIQGASGVTWNISN